MIGSCHRKRLPGILALLLGDVEQKLVPETYMGIGGQCPANRHRILWWATALDVADLEADGTGPVSKWPEALAACFALHKGLQLSIF